MKKSRIALGVIAVLGAAWLGGTWYTGNAAEQEYRNQIETINRQYQELGMNGIVNLTYQNRRFDRHFFSSDIQDELIITDLNSGKKLTLPIAATLYHGPLPLNRLSQFNVAPAMLAFDGKLDKNADTAPFYEFTADEAPLRFKGHTNYSGTVQTDLTIAAGKIEQSDGIIRWSPFLFEINADKNGNGKLTFHTENIRVDAHKKNDPNFKSVNLDMADIDLKADFKSTDWDYLSTGDMTFRIEQTRLNLQNAADKQNQIELKDFTMATQNRLNDAFFSQRADYQIDSVKVNGQSYGKFSYDSELNHLDAKSLNTLYGLIIDIAQQGAAPDPAQQAQFEQQFIANILNIVNNQPQLKISKLALENEKGKLYGDLNIALAANPDFNLIDSKALLNQFTAFSVNVDLSKAAAADILEKVLPSDQKAKTDIPAEIEKIAQRSADQGIFANNEKNVTFNLILEKGELKLNGNVIPEERLQTFLFMLAMGAMNR